MNLEIHQVPINDLKPASYNPRRLTTKQHAELKESITKFGLVDPIIVNTSPERNMVVVGGHQRLNILREIGSDTVPCVFVNLSLEQERELNVRLNKNTGEWDYEVLANEFDVELLMDIGFSERELELYMPPDVIDKEDEEVKKHKGNPRITLVFADVADLEAAEMEVKGIVGRYKGASYAVSAGDI